MYPGSYPYRDLSGSEKYYGGVVKENCVKMAKFCNSPMR